MGDGNFLCAVAHTFFHASFWIWAGHENMCMGDSSSPEHTGHLGDDFSIRCFWDPTFCHSNIIFITAICFLLGKLLNAVPNAFQLISFHDSLDN